MIRDIIAGLNFSVDNYIEIIEFEDIKLDIDDNDPYYIASIVGWLEGIFQISADKNYLTFLNMYKINLNSSYKFYGIYSFIKSHKECYNYIIKYFNTWHGRKNEIFTYDEYNKKDLTNNFYKLSALLLKEKELAERCNDMKAMAAYNLFCRNLSSFLVNS